MKRNMRSTILVAFGFLLGLLAPVAYGTLTTQAQPNATNCQTFTQTGHKVCGKFLTYWQQHGGLAQQGYPLSEEFVETSDLNGKPYRPSAVSEKGLLLAPDPGSWQRLESALFSD